MNISALGYKIAKAAITPKIAPEAPTIGVLRISITPTALSCKFLGTSPKLPVKISKKEYPSAIIGCAI